MANREELKLIADAAEELEKGYLEFIEVMTSAIQVAKKMGADAQMVKLRARAALADLTPTRAPSASALAATRHDSRSGMTAAGGFKVDKR